MTRRRSIRMTLECLEDRYVPTLNPSGLEQEMLEYVNRMRMNPAAELGRFLDNLSPIHSNDPIIDNSVNFFKVNSTVLQSQWSKLVAAAPLAWNDNLMTAALGHTNQMIAKDDQLHQFPGEPALGQRATNAGYNFNVIGESIFAYGETVFSAHAALAIDWGFTATGIQDPPGHRNNIMNTSFREVGISIVEELNESTQVGPLVITQDFGNRFNLGNSYLLGVVYKDLNSNGVYENGEGLSNVNIAIDGVQDFSTQSMTAGGYQIQLPAGNYTVTFSGGGLANPIAKPVTIGAKNVKLDSRLTAGGGAVNSAPVLDTKGAPALPTITEDNTSPAGISIGGLIVGMITDPDVGALKGAAVVGLTGTDKGTWEFSLDNGVNWSGMNDAAPATARLLRNTDKVRFRPNANINGVPTIQLRAWDRTTGTEGTTADLTGPETTGGTTAFSVAVETATITIVSVNDAPVGTSKTITSLEDKPIGFALADFGFTDPNDTPANAFSQLVITSLPTKGTFNLAGVPVAVNQVISVADLSAGKLIYRPAANGNGTAWTSFGFKVRDNGGIANGGINTDPVAKTITLNLTPVNDPPIGTNRTITINEDIAYSFNLNNFGFQESKDGLGQSLAAVRVTALPTKGTLALDGKAVTVNQEISAEDLGKGLFQFMPGPNRYGPLYSSFSFKVRDNGGTENGGSDLALSVNAILFNVNSVNDAPTGMDKAITILEDKRYPLVAGDFGFKDLSDSPANGLASVMITTLPALGTLVYAGKLVTLNQEIPVAEITLGKLGFTPAKDGNGASYASFGFKVRDNGGVLNGGVSLAVNPNTITFHVTAVNDPPLGANATVSLTKNTVYTFLLTDFSFSDPNDAPGQSLAFVRILSVPLKGSLTLAGVVVKANTQISASDIQSGKLKFTPLVNTTGNPYASFTFKIGDNGGIANGGINLDPLARILTIQVNS